MRTTRMLGSRMARPCVGALVALLVIQVPHLERACAEPPPPEAGAPPTMVPDEWDARLRQLEQRDAAVLEQNRQLTEQNREALEHNRALEENIQDLGRRYDELKRRLDETPPPTREGGHLDSAEPAVRRGRG